jgi:hypothetical protein
MHGGTRVRNNKLREAEVLQQSATVNPGETAVRISLACITALLFVGCSSLSPHIFSERLIVRPSVGGSNAVIEKKEPLTLEEAYADTAWMQARYATAVQDQGNATPQLSAWLIGLSAVTLFKGLTSPNSRDIAGAGVVGSASWALGSTLLSRPRLDVYRAGVEALGCAMATVEPMRRAALQLGKLDDAPGPNTLHGRMALVEQRRAALQALLDTHAELEGSRLSITRAPPPQRRTETQRPRCDIPADASPARALALRAECDQRPPIQRTVIEPAGAPTQTELRPPAALRQSFRNARDELNAANGQLASGERAVASIGAAAGHLWRKSVAIQLAVSEQVDKTVPDLAAVRSVAQGLRDTGFVQVGGTSAPGGSIKAQSDHDEWRPDARELAAQAAIDTATQSLRAARAVLDRSLRPLAGIDDAALLRQLNDCNVKTVGIRLSVTPGGDEITVAAGSTAVFFVSGGTGVPSAQVAAGPVSIVLTPKVEGGQFRFEFAVPPSLKAGDVLLLRFSDGANAASQLVQLRIAGAATETPAAAAAPAAAVASEPPRTANTAPVGAPVAAPVAAPAAASAARRIAADDLPAFFGLPTTATAAQVDEAVERCRSRLALAGAPGSLDKPMADALRAGRCKAGAG